MEPIRVRRIPKGDGETKAHRLSGLIHPCDRHRVLRENIATEAGLREAPLCDARQAEKDARNV